MFRPLYTTPQLPQEIFQILTYFFYKVGSSFMILQQINFFEQDELLDILSIKYRNLSQFYIILCQRQKKYIKLKLKYNIAVTKRQNFYCFLLQIKFKIYIFWTQNQNKNQPIHQMAQNRQKSIQKRIIQQSNTRQALWNVLEPGDPYDIKKSRIAKLPQHPPRFMGQHLQLVCLFQAAQIQRMSVYMQQMTIKIRQVQRVQLDRHSYQIQIKQLAQKVSSSNQLKIQIEKLNKFIKGQSQQMQNLQKHRHSSQNLLQLQSKYQKVLNQLGICRQNYSSIQKSNSQLLRQVTQWRYNYEKTQRILQQQRSKFQKQTKLRIQIAVNQYRISVQNRQYQLKGQINVMKQNLLIKNREIEMQKNKNASLIKQLAQKQQLIGKYQRGEIEGQKTQQVLKISKKLQQTMYLLEQSEKQSLSLKDEIQYQRKKIKSLQEQNKRKQFQFKSQIQQFNGPQLSIKISELQAKNKLLLSQIQRLNQTIQKRKKQYSDKDKQFFVVRDKLIMYQRRLEGFERDIRQKDDKIRRFQMDWRGTEEKDIKIQTMAKEIGRLNMVLQEKLNDLARLNNMLKDYNYSQSHHQTIIRSKQQAIRILESRSKQYELKILSLQQANKLNFDQINRLNVKLKNVQNENIHIRREFDLKVQSSIQQYKVQFARLTDQVNQKTLQNLKLRQDNQQMFRQITQLHQNLKHLQNKGNDALITLNKSLQQKMTQLINIQNTLNIKQHSYNQKLQMYQKSMPQLSQQIDRLHQILQNKQNQLNNLYHDLEMEREKVKMMERKNSTEYQMSVLQFEKKISFLQAKSQSLQKANQQLTQQRANIEAKIQSLQIKLNQSHQQLQKLKAVLRVRQSTFQQYQKRISLLQSTINQLKTQKLTYQAQLQKNRQQTQFSFQKIRSIQFQLDRITRDYNQSKSQLAQLKQQNRHLRQSSSQNQSLSQQIINLKRSNQNLVFELNKASQQKQQLIFQLNEKKNKILILQQSTTTLNSKVIEYQQSIRHIEQANGIKFDQYKQRIVSDYQNKLRDATNRYNQLFEKHKQLQRRYEYLEDNQQGQYREFQRQNKQLRQNLEQYQNKIFSYQQKIALLSQQLQRLSQTVKDLKQKLQHQKSRYHIHEQQQHFQQQQNQLNQHRNIQILISQLQQAKIQVTNLKTMIQQYESINEHAVAERDELFQITHEQQDKINHLNGELEEYKRSKQQHSSEYHSNKKQLTVIKQQYNLVVGQYTSLQNQYSNLQGQYSTIISQLEAYRRKAVSQQTLRQYELRYKQYEIRIHRITQQYQSALRSQKQKNIQAAQDMQKQARALLIIEQKNQELQINLQNIRQQVTSQQQVRQQVEQIKTAYINIKLQNEELNRMLQEMQDQLFQAKEQNNIKTNEQNSELRRLGEENLRLKSLYEQEKNRSIQTERQLNAVHIKIQTLKRQTQYRIQSIQSNYVPIEHQNGLLKMQIQQLNIQLANQISLTNQVSLQWQTKYKTLYQAYNQTYTIYNELKIQYQSVKQNLFAYKDVKLPQLEQQFRKLSGLVTQMKIERDGLMKKLGEQSDLVEKNKHLQEEIQRLQLIIKSLKQEISDVRIRLSNDNSLQKRIQQDMALMVILFAQIQTLRKRVQQTQQQCQDVRRNSISPFKVKK